MTIINKFIIILCLFFTQFVGVVNAQSYNSSSQVYRTSIRNPRKIERLPGPHHYGPHPGCDMCLGNHLIGGHRQSYGYLNKISYTQWGILHDNLHNRSTLQKNIKQQIKKLERQPIYVPTPQHVVDKMLEVVNPKRDEVLYDLGCGDGRIVITAAKKYGCKAVGYEINKELVSLAKNNVLLNEVKNLVEIKHADILEVNLDNADIITLYLFPELNEKLLPQLNKVHGRIISYCHTIPNTIPNDIFSVKINNNIHNIYFWKTPIKMKSLQVTGTYL